MNITGLKAGDLYIPKQAGCESLFAQVGEGGDVGFFRASSWAQACQQEPFVRTLMNLPDFRRHWKKIGTEPLHNSLDHLTWYGDSDVGESARYKVRLDDLDKRVSIPEQAYGELERLAVWETVHVLERLGKVADRQT